MYGSTLSLGEREGKLDFNLFYFFSPPLISFKETDKIRLEEKEEEEEEGFFAFQEFSLIRR